MIFCYVQDGCVQIYDLKTGEWISDFRAIVESATSPSILPCLSLSLHPIIVDSKPETMKKQLPIDKYLNGTKSW
ncbi:hypothetical protein LINGRAHAP2_LOCUS26986 [Linum grandiflorum]